MFLLINLAEVLGEEGGFEYEFVFFEFLGLFEGLDVEPAEVGVAALAGDIGDGVQTCRQQSVLHEPTFQVDAGMKEPRLAVLAVVLLRHQLVQQRNLRLARRATHHPLIRPHQKHPLLLLRHPFVLRHSFLQTSHNLATPVTIWQHQLATKLMAAVVESSTLGALSAAAPGGAPWPGTAKTVVQLFAKAAHFDEWSGNSVVDTAREIEGDGVMSGEEEEEEGGEGVRVVGADGGFAEIRRCVSDGWSVLWEVP